ncbi:hypothetical protein BDP81DRAFT_94226 [Colletotrichum phormii]|uniref:Secreted protein n=1 Tax=Colletotrichum phormii TaxID=359342 RepID=A0AAJ0A5S4_9PEZI|nr:uncharacterized protein BDP81DRAFT_94226 [Colletotrichum phormii]KAK1655105.1 hypothetical protein BDP81DRAFT_94226 [Colletotrichum phormii]
MMVGVFRTAALCLLCVWSPCRRTSTFEFFSFLLHASSSQLFLSLPVDFIADLLPACHFSCRRRITRKQERPFS